MTKLPFPMKICRVLEAINTSASRFIADFYSTKTLGCVRAAPFNQGLAVHQNVQEKGRPPWQKCKKYVTGTPRNLHKWVQRLWWSHGLVKRSYMAQKLSSVGTCSINKALDHFYGAPWFAGGIFLAFKSFWHPLTLQPFSRPCAIGVLSWHHGNGTPSPASWCAGTTMCVCWNCVALLH